MSKEQALFLEWFGRFNPARMQQFINEQRDALITGRLGVTLDAEKVALLVEAVGAGVLPDQRAGEPDQLKVWADQMQRRACAGAQLLNPANPPSDRC